MLHIALLLYCFQVQESLDAFERGMGILLRNAWGHLEALQTTDVPLLVEYITGVRKRESAEQDTGQDRDRTGTGQDNY